MPLFGLFGKKKSQAGTTGAGAVTAATGTASALADRAPVTAAPLIGGHRNATPAPVTAETAPLPPAPVSAETGTGSAAPVGGAGRIGEREPLTREKLMQRAAFQGMVNDFDVRELLSYASGYQRTISLNKIPAAGGPDFMRQMGFVNANIMASHDTLIAKLEEKAKTFRVKEAQKATRNQGEGRGAFRKRQEEDEARQNAAFRFLADDCANLATIAYSQRIFMNKIYDDMITASSANPDALAAAAGKSYAEILGDVRMYEFNRGDTKGTAQVLGGGAINTVYRDTFQGAEQVFKGGKTHERSVMGRAGEENVGLEVMRERMGYTPEELRYGAASGGMAIRDANTAQRDVAFSRINKLLGFDVAVSTQLAKSETGDASSLMGMGRGKIAADFAYHVGAEWAETAREKSRTDLAAQKGFQEERLRGNEAALAGETDPGMREDYERAIAEARGYLAKKGATESLEPINLEDPALAMQLFQMEVLDVITGHVDRHAGNFMMNKREEGGVGVTAIDNDTSFGLNTDVEDLGAVGQAYRPILSEAFPFVPAAIKNKIAGVSRSDIEQALTGLLSKPQIDAACARLEKLKSYFEELEKQGKVQDASAANMQELFAKSPQASYFAQLYSGSINADKAFMRQQEAARAARASAAPTVTAPQSPAPLPGQAKTQAGPANRPIPAPPSRTTPKKVG